MRPTQHPSNTHVLRPPAGMSNEQCRPLPYTRLEYEDGSKAVISFWQLTLAERAAIAAGAPVMLTVMGATHPPLKLGVDGVEEGA